MAAPVSYPAYPAGFPAAYPAFGGYSAYPAAAFPAPTVVPGAALATSTAPAQVVSAPTTTTLTALPEGYFGANTVSMSYLTVPVKDPHVVAVNPTPAAMTTYRNTLDSLGPSNRAKRATHYKSAAQVNPLIYGCYKPTIRDPKTGAPTWFRASAPPAGALGSFLGGL